MQQRESNTILSMNERVYQSFKNHITEWASIEDFKEALVGIIKESIESEAIFEVKEVNKPRVVMLFKLRDFLVDVGEVKAA